ncbi:pyruvate dehydrogenase complex dihydrolipoamide acetyltransferase component (E2) [Mycoemilia scoparia]|uniref:Acetyltransferase component of pyruvate dehydrogenase complex n=1 Tax=Mycoemilia scoparia TaxID=417184 RepID=A0A9W7ZZ68_9FUNG|nr:pyruvate dehydrogenase complex dihydrolipoamide acetyltransferase component (E2) [Mycoemilia scoparia]
MSAVSRASTIIRSQSKNVKILTPMVRRIVSAIPKRSVSTRATAPAFGFTKRFEKQALATNIVRLYSSKSYPDHIVVGMPALSPTMSQGSVGQWKKQPGDKVEPGDVLVEIETDKAQMDFEYQEEGYLAKIILDTGAKDINVETPIAIIVENEEDVAAFKDYTVEDSGSSKPAPKEETSAPATQSESAPEPTPASKPAAPAKTTSSPGSRIFVSPLARSIAEEEGVDLSKVTGTGPRGRIVKSDIEKFLKSAPKAAEAPAATTTAAAAAAPTPTATTGAVGYTDIPLSNMRQVIARRLTEAKSTIPHYYLTANINMDKVIKLRSSLNATANGKYKLSINDFIIKASAQALKDVPAVNSSFQGDFVRQHHHADIAVAVATPTGLITPIVKTSDAKGLQTISSEVKDLATRARNNKLTPEEYQGGSFTISNLGMYDLTSFSAIINPPHAAILAVGTSEKKLVLDESSEKGFRAINNMAATLSADHRVVDGATGAEFMKALKGYLENPLTLLL